MNKTDKNERIEAVVACGLLNVRNSASYDGAITKVLKKDTKLEYIKSSKPFVRVFIDGEEIGFVAKEFLK